MLAWCCQQSKYFTRESCPIYSPPHLQLAAAIKWPQPAILQPAEQRMTHIFSIRGWGGGGWDRYHQPSRNKTLVLCYTRFVITTLYCYTRKILPSLQENKVLVLRRSRHSLLPTVKILCKSCPIYSPRDGWQLAAAIKWLFCILPSYDYKISKNGRVNETRKWLTWWTEVEIITGSEKFRVLEQWRELLE